MSVIPSLRHRAITALAIAAASALALAGCTATSSASAPSGTTTVKMIQEWPTGDSFWIPWIVAKQQGYYKAEGIDLDIMAPPNTSATMQYLGTGRADLAFATSVDVVTSASKGVPVTSIARYGSGNNWGLMSSTPEPVDPASLKGKKIGTYTDSWSEAQLQIMLAHAGLKLDDVTLVTATDDTVPLLVQGKVAAITGVTNAEGSELTSLGKKYSVALAKDNGAPDAPVFSLAANKDWLAKNPKLAKGFITATIKGMNWARSHPKQAVAMFLKAYPDAETKAFSTLQWADTAPLLGETGKQITASDLEQSEAQWKEIAAAAKEYGVIKTTGSASSYFTNSAVTNR
ncbi:ABC transporter substrate-binding protein [Curtobacterium sp. 9128]|uniref:ABC transporter substrate-binding protein n=1 Tax=Curtobacterium sp. 9128 TaxID=1793722 RepID=UPI001C92E029|nr:ABC transporter substrate-binding protein [Curtobacterium sp. 9128]